MRNEIDTVKADLAISNTVTSRSRLYQYGIDSMSIMRNNYYPIKDSDALLVLPKDIIIPTEDLPLKLW